MDLNGSPSIIQYNSYTSGGGFVEVSPKIKRKCHSGQSILAYKCFLTSSHCHSIIRQGSKFIVVNNSCYFVLILAHIIIILAVLAGTKFNVLSLAYIYSNQLVYCLYSRFYLRFTW